MRFTEIYYTTPGSRVFNVSVEGEAVKANMALRGLYVSPVLQKVIRVCMCSARVIVIRSLAVFPSRVQRAI
jgi:hypothetical protein